MELQFKALGDQGVQVSFGTEISEQVCMHIQALMKRIHQQKHLPILECIPGYTTLSIYYDSFQLSYTELIQELTPLITNLKQDERHQPLVYEIPTLYEGEYGPDLYHIAQLHQLDAEEVVRIHAEPYYLIYMLGFTPGFPYLGGLDNRIAAPRLANPRARIAAGSVGIAGAQTGIYPIESPGGWNIIGRTPVKLYRPEHWQPFLLEAGHYIKFVPIDTETFHELSSQWEKGEGEGLISYPFTPKFRVNKKLFM